MSNIPTLTQSTLNAAVHKATAALKVLDLQKATIEDIEHLKKQHAESAEFLRES